MGFADFTPKKSSSLLGGFAHWQNKLVANKGFQAWASRSLLTRRTARKDGEKLFDLVAGFVYSQTLFACVELELLQKLMGQNRTVEDLAVSAGIPQQGMEVLCKSAVSVGLLTLHKDGSYGLARLGAALIGVPGLTEMIRHHDILYRDLSDPVALLRGETESELAEFWPYVLGQRDGSTDVDVVTRYSDLMAKSQSIIAEETLSAVAFSGIKTLMDVGGGTGAFLRAVGLKYPDMERVLFDLPGVVEGVADITAIGGSFLDPLPRQADAISLIRVLYDHSDETVDALLSNVFDALPKGGRIIISEPMSGGATPLRATDSYFSFYTLAMRTGRVRSQADIAKKLAAIGFADLQTPTSARPYVTSIVLAGKPA